MAKKKRGKVRTQFRKNHQGRVRQGDLTRDFSHGDQDKLADVVQNERVSGKGDLTRKRTVIGRESTPDDVAGANVDLNSEGTARVSGRVVSVHGLKSRVLSDDGSTYDCTIRQVLKSLSIEQRNVVVAGDRVEIMLGADTDSGVDATIEMVHPRHGIICRTSRGRQHVIAANVDYLLVIASAAQPGLKPALIDRFLLTAEQCNVRPVVVINKVDLIDADQLQQVIGVYASLGYRVIMTSAESGLNVDYLRALLQGKQTVLAGQSGVGKSSLLNAVQPGLGLAVRTVSKENDKGRHTTTASRLIPLDDGGAVFDTPGIRQFQLWDIGATEVASLMPDIRPYVSGCRYPNCLHLSEDDCAVKDAVADARIDARRYDSYCHLLDDELLPAEAGR